MKYVSINTLAFRLLKHPMLKDLSFDDIAMYTSDVIRRLGAPLAYKDEQAVIEVDNYKGTLPCDLFYIKQLRTQDTLGNYTAMRYNTTTFSSNCHASDSPDLYTKSQQLYTVTGEYINTSFEKASVEIAYKALAADEDGYPLIPDDTSVMQAIEYYIRWKTLEILSDLNQNLVYARNNAEKQYSWYVGQAETSLRMLTIDEMDVTFDALNRIIPKFNQHSNFFGTNNPEKFNTEGY